MEHIKVFLKEFPQVGFGYDLTILNQAATINDYITALDEFQNSTMAPCLGCDGCCHERIPLTIGDFFLARPFVAKTLNLDLEQVQLYHWLNLVADFKQAGQGLDIVLKAKANSSCLWLNEQKKACLNHSYRSFVCRTHCCLPKSNGALDLRAELVNAGEDELVRQILQSNWQEGLDQKFWQTLSTQNLADYPKNGFSYTPLDKWKTVKIKDVISEQLWGKLFNG